MNVIVDLLCGKCQHTFEAWVVLAEPIDKECPNCQKTGFVGITHAKAPGVHYKGNWFKNKGGY